MTSSMVRCLGTDRAPIIAFADATSRRRDPSSTACRGPPGQACVSRGPPPRAPPTAPSPPLAVPRRARWHGFGVPTARSLAQTPFSAENRQAPVSDRSRAKELSPRSRPAQTGGVQQGRFRAPPIRVSPNRCWSSPNKYARRGCRRRPAPCNRSVARPRGSSSGPPTEPGADEGHHLFPSRR